MPACLRFAHLYGKRRLLHRSNVYSRKLTMRTHLLLCCCLAPLLVGCSSSSRSTGSQVVNCVSDQTVLTGVVGIGLNHSANVTANLKDSGGRTIIPSSTIESEHDGWELVTKTYLEGRVTTGSY